jgi:hypothetical protein
MGAAVMKQVVYTDRARQNPKDYAALQAVTNMLEEVTRQSGDVVTAEWDKAGDPHGGPAYVLRLSDWSGSATKIFAPHDLQPTNTLWSQPYAVWGDLLRERSHRLIEEMRSSNGQGD